MALHDPDVERRKNRELKGALRVRVSDLGMARRNRFEFLLAMLMIAAGLTFFLDPESLQQTAVGHTVTGWLDDAWSMCYLIGGILICAGLLTSRVGIEAAGLWLAITTVVVNAYGILTIFGGRSLSTIPSLVLTALVCADRLLELRRAVDAHGDHRGN